MQIIEDLCPDPVAASRPDPAKIAFGKTFSRHSFVAEFRDGAWQSARIAPIEPFSLHPGALVLHYAQSIFEGLKAFAQPDGGVALFRPLMNARRFQSSAARMAMPRVDEALFLDAILGLVAADCAFIPRFPGSLYIRPAMIATQPYIGVSSSTEFKFFVITLPAGAYFPALASGAGAVDVLISESVVRAFPGGTGNIKTAANYAITLQVTAKAAAAGCGQVLFLDSSPARRVEELGGMNVLFVEDGSLVTPPLSGTILPGVIRDSVLQLAKDRGMSVREYAYTLQELQDGLRSGKITEAIACGTAAVVSGIRRFHLESGATISVGDASGPGPVTSALFEHLQGIQYGRLPDRHGWLMRVDGVHLD
ncbi:MAG: branched-chain amino acid aminotransferase [Bryobacteraceae bacterium]